MLLEMRGVGLWQVGQGSKKKQKLKFSFSSFSKTVIFFFFNIALCSWFLSNFLSFSSSAKYLEFFAFFGISRVPEINGVYFKSNGFISQDTWSFSILSKSLDFTAIWGLMIG